jgi:hypothetical protein
MHFRQKPLPAICAVGLTFLIVCSVAVGQSATKAESTHATPLMAQLSRFTAADVPKTLAPSETEVAPLKWDQPVPSGLPGKGMAQHPMLYVGEGYNKILLVDKGKIAWTYSTGPGWEYDDVWMLSQWQHSLYPHAIHRRGDAQQAGSLALRRTKRVRNPHMPAHRPE